MRSETFWLCFDFTGFGIFVGIGIDEGMRWLARRDQRREDAMRIAEWRARKGLPSDD